MGMVDRVSLEAFRRLPVDVARRLVRREHALRSLAEFARQAWHVHHTAQKLVWNWHLDAICEHLEAVTRGDITRLAINVPPGSLKSFLVSVYWPAWEWARSNGTLQYIVSSAAEKNVHRDAQRMREVCESEWYQKTFTPRWSWDPEQKAKTYFRTTSRGHRVSVTTGERVTGQRGDRIIIDDPLDAQEAITDSAALKQRNEWLDKVITSRTNNPDSPIVLIMQRLHELDATGHVLAKKVDAYVHLSLPALFEAKHRCVTPIFRDPRTHDGELLFPQRLPQRYLDGMRETLGSRDFAAQYQQRPAPAEGAIYRKAWLRYWRRAELPEFEFLVLSIDAAYKKSKDAHYNALQVWGVAGVRRFLLDQIWERMDLPDLIDAAWTLQRKWGVRIVIVENRANGPAVIAALEEYVNVIAIDPGTDSKEARAMATTPIWEAGNVIVPHPDEVWVHSDGSETWYDWVEGWVHEHLSFPAARFDDQVDATTQMNLWVNSIPLDYHVGNL